MISVGSNRVSLEAIKIAISRVSFSLSYVEHHGQSCRTRRCRYCLSRLLQPTLNPIRWHWPTLVSLAEIKPCCDRGIPSDQASPSLLSLIHARQLGLYDIVNAPGVAVDLSHIATPAKVEGYLPPNDGLKKALTGADVVVIPAGVPRKPGVSEAFFYYAVDVNQPL